MKNISLGMKAFLEAAGVVAYVLAFALTVQNAQTWFMAKDIFPNPVLSIVLFLLAFIISAVVCSSLILLYPGRLFFEGKKQEASKVFFWSVLWLVIFLVFFGSVALLSL